MISRLLHCLLNSGETRVLFSGPLKAQTGASAGFGFKQNFKHVLAVKVDLR